MTKTDFLQELDEALQGEVSPGVIRENLTYYDNYITQEMRKGRSEDEIFGELGGPRIIARTIIDSSEAAGEGAFASQEGNYAGQDPAYDGAGSPFGGTIHRFDLNKWYWKLLLLAVVFLVLFIVLTVVGGIFSLLFRFAGPLILIWLVYSLFKGMRR